jgi:lactate permease
MTLAAIAIWPQPLDPLHSSVFSALVAALPLILILVLMGGLRKSGLFASACGLAAAGLLAMLIWHMPLVLLLWSTAYGFIYALWPVLWIVFGGLWLYNLTQDTGKFELLRRWMEENASGDACVQAILVAFCLGALLEGSAGFGAPVAVTACLLVGLGFAPRRAVIVALIANTAPVAFGGLGIPIVALAGVTGLDLSRLSAMVGRQVPFLSFILPAYLVWVVAGSKGLRQTWPAALVGGGTFALAQFTVSNLWGPYAADVVAASTAIAALAAFLRFWSPSQQTSGDAFPVSRADSRPANSPLNKLSRLGCRGPCCLR